MRAASFAALAIIAALSAWASSSTVPQTLRQVHIYFRHGQRTPASTYPTDPYLHETFSPYGWGQLTNEGKKQQYEQGKWLRSRYNDFLGEKFSTAENEARATGVDRTKMSLALAMAGLWPPRGDQIWNSELLWQPVPYSAQELNKDTLLLVRSCPRYSEAFDSLLETEDIQTQVNSYSELYEYLTVHTGVNITLPEGVQDIYSTLKAEEDFGLQLPEWTKQVYPEPMKSATALSFVLNAYNKELQKIKAGPMVKKLLRDVDLLIRGKTKKKMISNAGHDSTVSNLMMGFGIWEPQVPVYNIMAMIEVHEVNGIYGLKFFLRNTTTHEPYQLTIPGCDDFCPIDRVKEAVAPILPEEHDEMCRVHDASYTPSVEGGP